MSKPLPKTTAEQALTAQFKRDAALLPGTAPIAAARRSAMATFERIGLPHRRVEAYKYTDLRERIREALPSGAKGTAASQPVGVGGLELGVPVVAVKFVSGKFAGSNLPADAGRGETFFFDSLAERLAASEPGDWLEGHVAAGVQGTPNAIEALNTALMSDGVTLRISNDATVRHPIALVYTSASEGPVASHTRNLVRVGRNARVTLVEIHIHPTPQAHQSNSVTELIVEDGAVVNHIKLVMGPAPTQHLSRWKINVGASASYRAFALTSATELVRQEIDVTFAGENAKIDISGLMLGRGREHIDTTLVIDHAVPNCESRELFKAVLDDQARAVFQGKVIVRPDAQKTDGKQMANALMLSESCEFDSKPELEIYADDVICGHGATVAEIDPKQLFYLRSRGIPKDEARAMLIESFAAEALEKIEDESIRASLQKIASDWFAAKRS